MKWYVDALRKYAEFAGRSRRKEFWTFMLFNCIIWTALHAIDAPAWFVSSNGAPTTGALYLAVVLTPTLAASVRRLHDTGLSGWWLLLLPLAAIGFPDPMSGLIGEGTPGENRYGPNPKAYTA